MDQTLVHNDLVISEPKPQTAAAAKVGRPDFDILFGFTLALFAAVLAITDLGAGKFGADELKLTNDKAGAYQWYQAKGIKETILEGQIALLRSLLDTGLVNGGHEVLDPHLKALNYEIQRYRKEKKEILLGSKAVDAADWAQEVDGQLGKVIGAKEIESDISRLDRAGEEFDKANLLLQLALVLGAIGVLMRRVLMKWVFYWSLIGFGLAGCIFSVVAFRIAS